MPEDQTLHSESQSTQNNHRLAAITQRAIRLSTSETGRKGLLSAVDQGVISLGNFAAAVLLARFVSPTELGIYTVGYLAVFLIRAIQEGIIIQPLNSFGAVMDDDDFPAYASTTGVFQLMLMFITAGSAALVGWLLTLLGNDMAGPAIFSLWFAFSGWQVQEFLRRVFYTRGEVLKAVINTVLSNLIRLGVIWWMGTHHMLNGVQGLNAIAWGALAAFILGMIQGRRYWSRHLLNFKQTWLQNWRFGRWVLGGTLANWVTVQFYPILTAGMISFAAAGAYQALQNLVAPVHVLLRAADTFLTPRIAKIFHKDGYHKLGKTLALTYLITGIPVAALLFCAVEFAEPLLRLVRDDTYLPFSKGIILLAIFYALWYAYSPLQTTLKSIRHSEPIFLANIVAMGSMFTVGLVMIRTWGVYGTMAGQAVNALIINIVLWLSWRKLMRKETKSPAASPDHP